MHLRFVNATMQPVLDRTSTDGGAVPRIGESIALRDPLTGEPQRWTVKNVVWDYSSDEPSVDVHLTVSAVSVGARVPSFAAYTD